MATRNDEKEAESERTTRRLGRRPASDRRWSLPADRRPWLRMFGQTPETRGPRLATIPLSVSNIGSDDDDRPARGDHSLAHVPDASTGELLESSPPSSMPS